MRKTRHLRTPCRPKTLWAGRILLALAVVHLVLMTGLGHRHVPDWLGLGLWDASADPAAIKPALGAFWSSYGSFGVPLLLLGAWAVRQARRGLPVPAFVGWGLGAWALGGAYLLEPTPFVLALVPAVLILRDQATAVPKMSPT